MSGGTISLPVMKPERPTPPSAQSGLPRIALVGNPNAGKTTLFNRLTGLRAKTSNFPGTTLESRHARVEDAAGAFDLIDLPGLYSAAVGQSEERLASDALRGKLPGIEAPDAVVVVVDATCLSRHLYLASEVREIGLPMVVALTMMDEARRRGLVICLETLARELDAPVAPVSGRTGEGVDALRAKAAALVKGADAPEVDEASRAAGMVERIACASCTACPHVNRHRWACGVGEAAGQDLDADPSPWQDRLDRVLTHPAWGSLVFGVVMAGLFALIFQVAATPMDWIDQAFASLGGAAAGVLPDGVLSSFLVDGVIAGVGGVVIFLPQVCLLFFVLTLLEDTGYLARAAFMADRVMRKVGLPGKAFVPMLSAHACAIPAIMSAKVIESRRDRLITILVLPLMTCSARLPVYSMVAALLFADSPLMGGLVFFGAYMLGIVAALGASLVLGKTVLRGKPQDLVLEMPRFRRPSLKAALLTVYDRGMVFLKKAGTVILAISICIWAATAFPIGGAPASEAQTRQAQTPEAASAGETLAEGLPATPALTGDPDGAPQVEPIVLSEPGSGETLTRSVAGRLGKFVEPVFEPLGFDWRISVGVMTSFAAREVVVSTLAIVAGLEEDDAEDPATLTEAMAAMRRPDGSVLFDTATSLSLLVFFVLAMQCLPTQAVTRRETGSWGWALLQLGYMTVLAYTASLIVYQCVSALSG